MCYWFCKSLFCFSFFPIFFIATLNIEVTWILVNLFLFSILNFFFSLLYSIEWNKGVYHQACFGPERCKVGGWCWWDDASIIIFRCIFSYKVSLWTLCLGLSACCWRLLYFGKGFGLGYTSSKFPFCNFRSQRLIVKYFDLQTKSVNQVYFHIIFDKMACNSCTSTCFKKLIKLEVFFSAQPFV